MTTLRTIESADVRGKRVLVRIDADVVVDAQGRVEPGGDHRLRGCLQTVEYLRSRGARVVLLAHLGRPHGKVVESLRAAGVGRRLSELLATEVRVLKECTGADVAAAVSSLSAGAVLLLENLRFDAREEENDPGFAAELAKLGDLYVNESFGNSHRAHASMEAITRLLPSYAGFLLATEMRVLERVLQNGPRPVVAAISGAKIETKAALLRNLLPRLDRLLPGGGIANMFLLAKGFSVGTSLVAPHMETEVREILAMFSDKIIIPTDVRVARGGEETRELTVGVADIQPDDTIYDLGPETIARFCMAVHDAKTCVWNGPLGRTELSAFQEGTRRFAECVSGSSAMTIVGGGDTIAALEQLRVRGSFRHVSTGGGAMITLLEGSRLPAVDALLRSTLRLGPP